ncbi:hypothetical protein [Nocardia wallacei]|uniref:hypothetical protein n=1 Tax=Nocardia wallacei TaxID=480035 RepID=UPI0024547E2B|nr:hypothetical protein [Nocardia wallacei]
MTENGQTYISQWIASLLRSANRHGIVFVPLGAGFDGIRSTCERCVPANMTAIEYLDGELGNYPESSTVALRELEVFCQGGGPQNLSSLRQKIHEDCENGNKFILFSRLPKSRYPDVPGSSVLIDAKVVTPPLMPVIDDNGEMAFVLPTDDGTAIEPSGDLIVTILSELGMDAVSDMDRIIFESMVSRDEVIANLQSRTVEGLAGAGLVRVADDEYVWAFPRSHSLLRRALADGIARYNAPPSGVTEAFGLIWSIERSLRCAMRTAAIMSCPNQTWQTHALNGNLPAEVLERASGDAYPAAKSIKEIRDPLEWLTLGELLELRRSRPKVYGSLGVEDYVWRSFTVEVPAIRNRLSHMRLLQEGDLGRLKKWHTTLTRKLKMV